MSIRKRGKNSFEIDVYLGRDPVTGKRLRDTHAFTGTLKGARAEQRRLLRERDLGTYVSPSTLTVGEYLDQWLRDYAKPNVAGNTYEGYERIIRLHVKPHLERVPLSKLRPLHVQGLYGKLLAQTDESGAQILSAHSVLHVHRALKQALKQAVRWQLLAVNPCDAVDPPRREHKEMQAITENETARLLEGLSGTRYRAPVLVAVTCGLRRGELLGLRWQDVDLDGGKLSVRQALEQTKAGIRAKQPKTAKSRRQLSVPAFVVAELRQHRKEQNERRLEQGNTWQDHDLVFPSPNGAPWSPSAFSRLFLHHARRLGVSCRLHDLRHSHATQLLHQGVHPKIVSERLGHSTVGFTLDTYTHAVQGMDEDAAALIGAAIEAHLGKPAAKDA